MGQVHEELLLDSIAIESVPLIEFIHATQLLVNNLNEELSSHLIRYVLPFSEGGFSLNWLKR